MTRDRLKKLLAMARCQGALTEALAQPDDVVGPSLKRAARVRIEELDIILLEALDDLA